MKQISKKWSFEIVKAQLEQLQKEFNLNLVSVLNSCEEPVICPVITTSSRPQLLVDLPNVNKESPVYLNLIKRQSIGMCAEHTYSESSST